MNIKVAISGIIGYTLGELITKLKVSKIFLMDMENENNILKNELEDLKKSAKKEESK